MPAGRIVLDQDLVASVGFVHLHVHSSYSLREGALTIEALAKLAKADAMPALAITDSNNLFGALEFSEKLAKAGVQPIVGAQIAVDFGDAPGSANPRADQRLARAPIVLLAQSEAGYRNLMRLASEVWLAPTDGDEPHLRFEALGAVDGLIALTGGPAGPIDCALAAGLAEVARARLARLAAAFDRRLYVELQRHGLESERLVEPQLLALAYAHGLPLVAANEAYFAAPEDHEAQDALLCIADGALIGAGDRRRLSGEHWFKPRAAMAKLFADLPEATANSVEIARRCAFRAQTRKPILPRFPLGGGRGGRRGRRIRAPRRGGARRAARKPRLRAGLHRGRLPRPARLRARRHRQHEVSRLFPDRRRFHPVGQAAGHSVGPGRGSGAGSLVAYALTITDLDPIRFGLLFERFLNPERVSMPDFDIDF